MTEAGRTDHEITGPGEDPASSDAAPFAGEEWLGWGRSGPRLPRTIGETLDTVLSRQTAPVLWLEALLLLAGIGVLDYTTGTELAFSIFYLVPVIFATWFISRRAGLTLSVLSAGAWAAFDNMGGLVYSSKFIPVWNGMVRLVLFLVIMQLVHVMKESRIREAALARTDSLTGVANGRSFSDRARLDLATARRTGAPLTMAYIDLDHFKRINDTVGHTEGDRLLRIAARAIGARLRATDLVARLGGDEFGVLLPNTNADEAPIVLADVMDSVRSAVDGSWDVSCTIGAVTFDRAPESVDFMVRTADELMYRGKRAGRGRIEHSVWPGPDHGHTASEAPATC